MGWKGKIVGKVGNYLTQSLEAPLKTLYSYAAPKEEVQVHAQGIQVHTDQRNESPTNDYEPDTSSLTAFLLSLLSSSDTNHSMHNDSPDEASDDVSHSSRCDYGASTSGSWAPDREEDLLENQDHGTSSARFHSSLYNLENEETRIGSPKQSLSNSQSSVAPLPASPTTGRKLPPLSDESLLLSDEFRVFLYSSLPTLVKDRHWILLYSTAKHGISLRTLYRRSGALPPPLLLVAADFHGVIFGGLLTAPLKPTSKRKYQGNNDTFVFTNVSGKPQLFKATGINRYYFLCMNEGLSFGGGNHFALHLDEDLLNGSSGSCDTFGNSCLAGSTDFPLANVEVWGFAHLSRYASSKTAPGFQS